MLPRRDMRVEVDLPEDVIDLVNAQARRTGTNRRQALIDMIRTADISLNAETVALSGTALEQNEVFS